MMRKIILTVLLMIVSIVGVNAQYISEGDTLRITLTNDRVYDYLWRNFFGINFSSDYTKMMLQQEDAEITFDLNYVKSVRFYNRFSNPQVVLKAQQTGAYDGLFQLSANPGQMFYFISCVASDEMLGGGNSSDGYVHEYDLLMNGANNNYLNNAWNQYYQAIYTVNASIYRLQNLPREVSSAEQHHALGEALFLRAFYYYELASIFGAVPMVTDNNSWAQKMTTTTPEQVWGQILYDLKTAIAEMDERSSADMDDSRVGKYAAEAMLARAYLFYTGFYLGVNNMAQAAVPNVNLPDGTILTKNDVIAYIEDCVNNSGFTLVPDYRNLWPYTNRITREDYSYTKGKNLAWVEDDGRVNPEVLFKIKYNKNASWSTTVGYSNQIALYLGMRGQKNENTFPFGEGWGYGPVSPALYSDWNQAEPQDMRRDASIQDVTLLPNYQFGGYNAKDYLQETQYHEKKLSSIFYKDSENSYLPFEVAMYGKDGWGFISYMMSNIHPLNLIRFADVLLMHSELTGTVDGINQVRARAGLSPLSVYSLNALQQERRWELAFEGVRWNDMRRFGDDYCKAALDAQMNQPIYNNGVATTNPQGLSVYEADARSYSAHYAENRGFFKIPEAYQQAGGMLLQELRGEWTYDVDEQNIYLDKVVIGDTKATRYDPACKEVATGQFVITPTQNYDQRICQLTFHNSSMLPMSKNYADQEGTITYDLISLADNKMVLKANGKELKLRRTNSEASTLGQIHDIKWSYGTYKEYNWYDADYTVFGTFGLTSWEEPYISQNLPKIAGFDSPYIQGTAATELSAFVNANNMNVPEGEVDAFAYMVFDLYAKTIKKYMADGRLISTGTFTLEQGQNGVILHTSEKAILVPYMYNGESETVKDFLLKYRDGAYYAPLAEYSSPLLMLMSQSTINSMNTYWMFGQRGFTTDEFAQALTIQQQEKDGTPSATGRFLSISLDRPRFCIHVEDADTGEEIFTANSSEPFAVKVPSGETVAKKLRFRLKNCNDTETVIERTLTMYNPDPVEKIYVYGGPDRPDQVPFQPEIWDASAMRFSDTEGTHFPTLPDEVYFSQKTLIFDVSDVSDDFNLRVMNGWWSNTYYDNVKWTNGLNEVKITSTMANECAKSGDGKDLTLVLFAGSMKVKAVYYEE